VRSGCSGTGEAVVVENYDVGDALVLFDIFQQALEFFSAIGLGALVCSPEVFTDGDAVGKGIVIAVLALHLQASVVLSLLLTAYAGVDNRFAAPFPFWGAVAVAGQLLQCCL
jgi:hypothetical protein